MLKGKYLPNQYPTAWSHRGLDRRKYADTIFVRPVVQDIAEPINIGPLDRVFLEEVVGDKFDPASFQCGRILARPDVGLCLLQNRRPILDDKIEFRINVRQLNTEPA